MTLHAQMIERNGKKEFVVLPYEEFLEIQERLSDYEDLKDLREAKEDTEKEPGLPLSDVRASLNI